MANNFSFNEYLVIDTTGSIGIGSTNPQARLFVTGSIADTSQTTVIFKPGSTNQSGGAAVLDVQNSSGTSLLFVSGSGAVGIGTTVSQVPSHRLHVAGKIGGGLYIDSSLEFKTDGTTELKANSDLKLGYALTSVIRSTGNVGVGTLTPSSRLHVYGSSTSTTSTAIIQEGTTPSGGAAALDVQNVSGTTLFFVSGSGRVGIASSSPSARLEINLGGSNAEILALKTTYSADNSYHSMTWRDGSNITGQIDTRYDGTNVDMVFGSLYSSGYNSTERLRIKGNGNVGIGTSLIDSKLVVNGNSVFSGSVSPDADATRDLGTSSKRWRNLYASNISGSITGSNLTAGQIVVAGSGGVISGSNDLVWDNTNKFVGIGTGTPTQALHVRGSTGSDVIALVKNDGAGRAVITLDSGGTSDSNVRFASQGSNKWAILNTPTDLGFYNYTTSGYAVFIAGSTGNVGVNTTTTTAKFTVSGSSTASTPTMVVKEGVSTPTGGVGTFDVQNSAGVSLLFVSGSGRIGIATTPSATITNAKLEVNGSIVPTTHLGSGNNIGESTNYWGTSYLNSGYFYNGSTNSISINAGTFQVYSQTSPTSYSIYADTNNRVGIGAAAISTARLLVSGTSTTTDTSLLVKHGTANGSALAVINAQNSAGTSLFFLSGSGAVGIGTTVPAYPLHVYRSGLADGSTNTHLMFDGKFSVAGIDQNDMIGMSSRLENSGGGSQTTFNIGFSYQAGANAILLQPTSGYVGIGTNNPSSKLHVVSGDIRFDNTYGIIGATNTAGYVLRGDGTRFVPAAIQASDVPTLNQNTTGQAGSVANSVTFNNSGAGSASGATFNGGSAVTVSYNTIGAQAALTNPVTGTGTTSYVARWTGTGTLGTGVLYDNATNAGVGTNSPQALLHVGAGGDAPAVSATAYVSAAGTTNLAIRDSANDVELLNYAYSGGGLIGTVTSHSLGIRTANSTAITIDTSQNVGIGTATVGTRLHVYSGATDEVTRFESTGNPYISLYDTGVRQGYLYSNTSSVELVAENSKPLYLQGATEIRLRTNTTTDRVIINSGGVVGINYTPPVTTAVTKLMVSGDIGMPKANAALLGNLYYDTAVPGWKYGANGYGWGFREDNAGLLQMVRAGNNTGGANAAASISLTDLFTFDLVNNRVGLGTGSPSTKFHVLHSSNDPVMIEQTTDAAWNRIYFKKPTRSWTLGPDNSTGTNNLFVLADETAGAYRVTVDTSGNVGINTASMSRKLVVHGSDALINGRHVGGGNNSTDTYNTALGDSANGGLSTGSGNTAVGRAALISNSTGNNNVALGSSALQSQTSGNATAIGTSALWQSSATGNTAVGYNALQSNTTASGSVGVGYEVLYNSNGADNTALGWWAGRSLSTGTNSVAIGSNALRSATTTSSNVAIGFRALELNTGSSNTVIGAVAGYRLTTGGANVSLGALTLTATTAASGSTAIGTGALANVTGDGNTAVGYAAGSQITSGTGNVVVGSYSGNSGGLDISTTNNNVVLSDGQGNVRMHIDYTGAVGIGTTTAFGGYMLHLYSGSNKSTNMLLQSDVDMSTGIYLQAGSGVGHFYRPTGSGNYRLGTTSSTALDIQTGGTTAINIDTSQNVGVGTASTGGDSLRSYRSSGNTVGIYSNTSNASLALSGYISTTAITAAIEASGGAVNMGAATNHALKLLTNATLAMTIDTSQRVGVGTGTPDTTANTKLHVYNGNAIFNNTYGINWTGLSGPTNGTRTSQLLDHYDYGTWTPAFAGSSTAGTYTLANTKAYYVRVGKLVVVSMYTEMTATSYSAGSGDWRITGLPYASSSGIGIASVGKYSGLASNVATISGVVEEGNTYVEMYVTTANGAANAKAAINTYVGTSTKIAMTITFRVT